MTILYNASKLKHYFDLKKNFKKSTFQVNDDPHVLRGDVAGAPPRHQRVCCGVGRGPDRAQRRGQRVAGDPQVSLVSRAGDLWPRDIRPAAGSQGDVGSQNGEEQDHQLRARSAGNHLLQDGV